MASIGSLIYTILCYRIGHKSYYTPPSKVRPLFQTFPPDYYRLYVETYLSIRVNVENAYSNDYYVDMTLLI